jgi:hypothetical protein
VSGLVLRPEPAADVDAVAEQLDRAFEAMRNAVLAGEPVTVLVGDGDLLGHGSVYDAAVSAALLGMVRALALEGARDGWQLNVATHAGDDARLDDAIAFLGRPGGLSGQLVRAGTGHLGRVWP